MNQPPINKGIDWSTTQTRQGSILEYFWSTRRWGFSKTIALILAALAVAIPMFVMYRGIFPTMNTRVERSVMITMLLLFSFLKFPLGSRKWHDRPDWLFAIDATLVLLTIGAETYTIYSEIVRRLLHVRVDLFGLAIAPDHIVGWVMILLLLEATRRTFGWILVSVPAVFLIYALTADWWPGPLMGAKASWTYLAGMLYSEMQGIYGIGAHILLSMVFVFLLFGSLMVSTNVGAFFSALANALVGRYAGGPAKVAILASSLFGMISGSSIANAATCGAVTIPLMKKIGYEPTFAAAVEATSSGGGYFTPPIMGAAAFLISAFTNTPYLKVALYAALPAFLYYLAIFAQVHLRAKKNHLTGLPPESIPSARRVLLEGGHLLLPVVVILVALGMGFSIALGAIWGCLTVILVSFFKQPTRQNPRGILVMLERATSETIGIAVVVVVMGILEGAVMVSGLGMRLSMLVETLAMGNLFIGLLVAGIVLVLLGLAVNPTLTYYIGYIFIIPALIKLGALEMPTHLFVLIFGGLADITPPVCITAFTTAAIAGAPQMATGWAAARLGFAKYIVPFLLVLHPSLLLMGGAGLFESALAIATSIVGICFVAVAAEGWLRGKATALQRIMMGAGGLLLMAPQLTIVIVGFGVLALGVGWHYLTPARELQKTGVT